MTECDDGGIGTLHDHPPPSPSVCGTLTFHASLPHPQLPNPHPPAALEGAVAAAMNARATALLLRAAAESGPLTMARVSALCVRGCIQLLATCTTLAALQPEEQADGGGGGACLSLSPHALATELAAAVTQAQQQEGEEGEQAAQSLQATFAAQLQAGQAASTTAVWADPPCLPLGTPAVLQLGLPAVAAAGAPRPQRVRVLLESHGAVLLDTLAVSQGQAVLR